MRLMFARALTATLATGGALAAIALPTLVLGDAGKPVPRLFAVPASPQSTVIHVAAPPKAKPAPKPILAPPPARPPVQAPQPTAPTRAQSRTFVPVPTPTPTPMPLPEPEPQLQPTRQAAAIVLEPVEHDEGKKKKEKREKKEKKDKRHGKHDD